MALPIDRDALNEAMQTGIFYLLSLGMTETGIDRALGYRGQMTTQVLNGRALYGPVQQWRFVRLLRQKGFEGWSEALLGSEEGDCLNGCISDEALMVMEQMGSATPAYREGDLFTALRGVEETIRASYRARAEILAKLKA